MEIKLYMRMLQKNWWIVVLTVLLAINVALVTSYFTNPIYRVSARFSVSPSSIMSNTGAEVLSSMEALDKRSIIQTYAEFLNSQKIYEETLQAMNLNPVDMEKYTHSTVVITDTNILELTVEGPDAKLISALANNTGQNAILHIKQLYKIYDINLLDPAVVPVIPVSPQPLRNAGLAALLGLVIGAILAIGSEQIRVPLDAYRQRASHDPVSLVFNQRYLQHRMDESFSRNPTGLVSFGLVRLNGLRDLIDTLPLSVVQLIMRQVSAVLQKELRGNDMVGRWNDTTFAILLPETSDSAAARTMDRIRTVLLKPVNLANYGETILLDPTTSISTSREGDSTGTMTGRAEESLEHNQTMQKNINATAAPQ